MISTLALVAFACPSAPLPQGPVTPSRPGQRPTTAAQARHAVHGPGTECLWDGAATAPLTRVECATVTVDGKFYTFGGFTDFALIPTTRADVYDPQTNAWTQLADVPTALTHTGFAADGDEVWIVGGYEGQHPGAVVKETWRYDIQANTWSPGPPLPAPRGSGAMVRVGRSLHFFGGTLPDRDTDSADHWTLDLDAPLAWQPAAPVPTPRNHASAAVVNGRVYYIGGQFNHDTNPIDIDVVESYDPATDTWSTAASLPFARGHCEPGTIAHDGRILLVGGHALGLAWLPDVSVYDPGVDAWSVMPSLPVALFAPAATVIDEKLIVTGGFSPLGPLPTTRTLDLSVPFGTLSRLSSGSDASFSGADGGDWCTDQYNSGGQPYRNPQLQAIAGTTDDELYLTERSGTNEVPTQFSYRIPASDGLYRLRFHFAEIYWGAPGGGPGFPGARVFDVSVEGEVVIDDLDIFAEVGAARALTRTAHVAVRGGAIDIDFVSSADRPKVSGIEIEALQLERPSGPAGFPAGFGFRRL